VGQNLDQDRLTVFDELIRSGQGDEALRLLGLSNLKLIADDLKAAYADIARRAGSAGLALKIISPLTRKASYIDSLPGPVRLAYGAALVDAGAFRFGANVLKTLDSKEYPQALLFQAHAHFNEWRSDLALPLLRTFAESEITTPYEKMLGDLNLASALIGENQGDLANEILLSLVERARKAERKLILGSALELMGQMNVLIGQRQVADKYLTEAIITLGASHILPALWARKWQAINDLLWGSRTPDALNEVRLTAVEKRDYETVRECDLFLAKFHNDLGLATKLYYGTSYPGYRQRMKTVLGSSVVEKIPQNYDHYFPPNPDMKIDLFDGEVPQANDSFEFGSLVHQLIFFLASDLFKPFRIAHLFMSLFPDERFDMESSPPRVHQVIARLREWAEKNKAGVQVMSQGSQFWLAGSGYALHYSRPIENDRIIDLQFEKIKFTFGKNRFTSKQVAELLGINVRSAQRSLKIYREKKFLLEYGAGRNLEFWIDEGVS
jgi:hypothetical protein